MKLYISYERDKINKSSWEEEMLQNVELMTGKAEEEVFLVEHKKIFFFYETGKNRF